VLGLAVVSDDLDENASSKASLVLINSVPLSVRGILGTISEFLDVDLDLLEWLMLYLDLAVILFMLSPFFFRLG